MIMPIRAYEKSDKHDCNDCCSMTPEPLAIVRPRAEVHQRQPGPAEAGNPGETMM